MENNRETKAAFMAMYWGQEVLRNSLLEDKQNQKVDSNSTIGISQQYLELTPLSAITDEHAIEVAKIAWRSSTDLHLPNYGRQIVLKITNGNYDLLTRTAIHVSDYLRSQGYALPYMGISVQEQIARGWVKLKEG